MKSTLCACIILCAFSVLVKSTPLNGNEKLVNVNVDWSSFLGRHDPLWFWDSGTYGNWSWAPNNWWQAAFIGNGLVGALISTNTTTHSVEWEVGRTDVWDNRQPNTNLSCENNFAFDRPRLPIGKFHIVPSSPVVSGDMTIDIYNAEATGSIQTKTQKIDWRSLTHALYNVTIIEVFTNATSSSVYNIQYIPERAISPWVTCGNTNPKYLLNPVPYTQNVGPFTASYQPLLAGGGYVTAWANVAVSSTHSIFYFTTGYDKNSLNAALTQATGFLTEVIKMDFSDFVTSHQIWWHDYYPASFVTIPETKVEGFYWLQMYKLGSGTRSGRPVLDLMGPWMVGYTGWPDIHWDLNVQLTYWPMYTSNRLTLAESLLQEMETQLPNLLKNVPSYYVDAAALPVASAPDTLSSCYWIFTPDCLIEPPVMTGNLLWVCHNYWLHYRRTLDPTLLKDGLYPLLRKSVNFYLQFIEYKSPDGYFHLPVTFSPEFPISGPDTNYDLMLLKWGCKTLLEIVKTLNIFDPLQADWQQVIEKLVPYPVDPTTGSYMIAEGVPLNISHRHYSHLFAIYPLGEVTWDVPSDRPLIEASVDLWIGQQDALAGFSLTGAASMSARIGRAEAALGNLTQLLNEHVQPNTMYFEGANYPVIETPLSAADSIHDMLLQSWGDDGLIKVFPTVSASWTEVSFSDLLAEGAFEVSAVRVNSTTQFIQVTSLAGSPCAVQTDMQQPIVAYPASIPISVSPVLNGVSIVSVDLAASQTVVLYTKGAALSSFVITPLVGNVTQNHYWGFHPLP